MKGKILVLSSVVTILSIMTSTGSLAYLMDTDESVATFTTGNVAIRNNTTSSNITQSTNTCENMLKDNICTKSISATNIGPTDAYARVRILVPTDLVTGSSPAITITTATGEFVVTDNITIGDDSYRQYEHIWSLLAASATTSVKDFSITYNLNTTASVEGENASSVLPTDPAELGIRIYTEAIQAQGFENAAEAFNNFN